VILKSTMMIGKVLVNVSEKIDVKTFQKLA